MLNNRNNSWNEISLRTDQSTLQIKMRERNVSRTIINKKKLIGI